MKRSAENELRKDVRNGVNTIMLSKCSKYKSV